MAWIKKLLIFTAGCLFILTARKADAFAPPLPGIFNSPQCIEDLSEISRKNKARYRKEGKAYGITDKNHLDEYVARRIRSRYLQTQYQRQIPELDFFKEFSDFWSDQKFLDASVSARKTALQKLMIDTIKRLNEDFGTLGTLVPFLEGVFETQPPLTIQEKTVLKLMMRFRDFSSLIRAETSRNFYKKSTATTVSELPRAELDQARDSVDEEILTTMAAVGKDIFDQANQIIEPVESGEEGLGKDFIKIANGLLDPHAPLPRIIKEDISKQLDFDKKYGYQPHPFFKAYVYLLYGYFFGQEEAHLEGVQEE